MREYRYTVGRDGRIFHEGTELVDPMTLRFFLRAMTRTPDGRYLVVCQGEHNWFDAADTPFVVQRLAVQATGNRLDAVDLVFAGECREPLDPRTLQSEDGHLFCTIRPDAFRARFGRVAMQQIAPFLDDDGGGPALALAGVRYPIRDLPTISGRSCKRDDVIALTRIV
jgi:hypothetical protein